MLSFLRASRVLLVVAVLVQVLTSHVARAELDELDAESFDQINAGTTDWLIFITSKDDPNAAAGDMLYEMYQEGLSKYGLKVGSLDCSVRAHRKVCITMQDANPRNNIRLIHGKPEMNPYTKKLYRKSIPYEGSNSLKSFEKFLLMAFPGYIQKTNTLVSLQETVDSATKVPPGEQQKGTMLLLTEKGTTPPLWRQVCFRSKIATQGALATKGAQDIYTALGVDTEVEGELPAVFYVPPGTDLSAEDAKQKVLRFSGDLKKGDSIVAWAAKLAPTAPTPLQKNTANKVKDGDKYAVHPIHTTTEGLENFVSHSSRDRHALVIAVVAAADAAETVIDGWGGKTRQKADGSISATELRCLAAITSDDNSAASPLATRLCALPLPTIVVLPPKRDRKTAERNLARHAVSTVEMAFTEAYDSFDDDLVIELESNENSLNMFVQQAMLLADERDPEDVVYNVEDDEELEIGSENKRMGISVVLLSDKNDVPAVLKNLAQTYRRSGVQVGFMSNPSSDFIAQFGSPKLPTMIGLFPNPEDYHSDSSEVKLAIQPYAPHMFGKLNWKGMNTFVQSILVSTGVSDLTAGGDQGNELATSDETANKPLPFTHLQGVVDWDHACAEGSSKICVIMITDDKNTGVGIFNSVAHKLERMGGAASAYSLMYTEGLCQPNLAAGLGIELDQLPAVAVYSPAKRRVANYAGALDGDNIKDWLVALRNTRPVSERPMVYKVCQRKRSRRTQPLFDGEEEEVFNEDELEELVDSVGAEEAEDLLAEIRAEEEAARRALEEQVRAEKEAERQMAEARKVREEEEEAAARRRKKKKKGKKGKKGTKKAVGEL